MTRDDVIDEMRRHFHGEGIGRPRKYVGGLLPSFCDFLIELEVPGRGYLSLADLFAEFPQITEGVSTLTVSLPEGGQKTIRPAYERYHHLYVTEHHRLDYPRSGPYATGKWADYRRWLDALVAMPKEDLDLGDFTHFAAAVTERAALGMIVAEDFQNGVREEIEALGLHPLARTDLLRIVALWDPLKQRAALNAFQWVVVHKEQNSGLIERVQDFLVSVGYVAAPATADDDMDAGALTAAAGNGATAAAPPGTNLSSLP